MKLPTKQVLGKDIKPGDLIWWGNINKIDIALTVELREVCVYIKLLTQECIVDWGNFDLKQFYNIIEVATSVRT